MAERVSDEIGHQLPYSAPVAINGSVDRIFGFDLAAGRRQPQFIDHLMQHGLKRLAGIAIKGDTPPSRPRAKSSTLSISPAIRSTVVSSIAMT